MGKETSVRGRTYTSGPVCAAAAGEPCSERSATYSSPSAFSNSCRQGQHRWVIRTQGYGRQTERPLSPQLNLTNSGLELGPCWMVSPHLFIAPGSSETPSQQRPGGTGSPVLLGEGLQSSRDRGRAALHGPCQWSAPAPTHLMA